MGEAKKHQIKSIVHILFHALGFSAIASSIILQLLMLTDIAQKGYFLANEENHIILSLEILLTIFAFAYLLFLFRKSLSQSS